MEFRRKTLRRKIAGIAITLAPPTPSKATEKTLSLSPPEHSDIQQCNKGNPMPLSVAIKFWTLAFSRFL
jgi:hypothetical protein